MQPGTTTGPRRVWLRAQQAPVQIAVAFLAAVQAALLLVDDRPSLSAWGVLMALMLIVGGVLITVARLRDLMQLESIGDALLIGALVFVMFEDLQFAEDGYQVASVVCSTGALIIGFGVRLYTVRKAVRAVRRYRRGT